MPVTQNREMKDLRNMCLKWDLLFFVSIKKQVFWIKKYKKVTISSWRVVNLIMYKFRWLKQRKLVCHISLVISYIYRLIQIKCTPLMPLIFLKLQNPINWQTSSIMRYSIVLVISICIFSTIVCQSSKL